MTNIELIKKVNTEMTFDQQMNQAKTLVSSGFLPQAIKTPEQALAIMTFGRELDLLPWQSFSTIYVVNGKPTVGVQLMLAKCHKTKELESFKVIYDNETKPTKTSCTVKRKGMDAFTSIFSLADAESQGLANKDNWRKQPKVMMTWRAIAQALRFVFPDAVLGLYTPDELGATVDVNPQTQEIVEVHDDAKPVAAEVPAPVANDEVAPQKGEDIPDDQLPNVIFPKGKYQGKRLAEVLEVETQSGHKIGIEYLEWCAENLKTEWLRVAVRRYLDIIFKEPEIQV